MRHHCSSWGIFFPVPINFRKELSSRIDPGLKVKELGGLYISFDGSKSKPVSSSLQKLKEKKIQDEVNKRLIFFFPPLFLKVICGVEWIMNSKAMQGRWGGARFLYSSHWLWPFYLGAVECSDSSVVFESCGLCWCPQVMKKSVIGPDFEKKDAVPPYSESKHALKLKRRVSLKRNCFDWSILVFFSAFVQSPVTHT